MKISQRRKRGVQMPPPEIFLWKTELPRKEIKILKKVLLFYLGTTAMFTLQQS
jgi:hypothetical protein